MAENQNPTPNTQTPDDGTTPGNQAGSPGQGGDPPEGEGGKKYDQAYVDRLKASAEGSKQEAERLKGEKQLLESNNQLMVSQLNRPAPAPTPVAPATPEYVPGTWLTSTEDAEMEKAYEDLDHKAINRLTVLQTQRQTDASQAKLIRTIGTVAGKAQTINSVTTDLNAAPEFKDPLVRQDLLLKARAAGQDPRYGDAQWDVQGFGNVNPYALMDMLKDHRIAKGGAIKTVQGELAPEGQEVLAGSGPASASPRSSPDTFNSSEHLTPSERNLAIKGMGLKSTPTSGMTDPDEAYRKIWDGLSEEVRVHRLSHGAPTQIEGQSGKVATTIWKAKKSA